MKIEESLERAVYALEAIARELDGIRTELAFERIEADRKSVV